MDRLSVMRAFCRIVERRSFARAAEDLEVSAAVLSRDLRLLEQSLGCALLARTTRRMSLTEQGQIYYEEARRILADIAQAEDAVRRAAGRISGRLRINAPHSFGVAVLAPLLPSFRARHPEVALSLSLDDRVVDMIEGGFDLTIRIRASLPDSDLVAREIGTVQQALFASPDYLARHGVPSQPQDLLSHLAVAYLHADAPSTWELRGPEGTVAIRPEPPLMVGSSIVLRDMLVGGQGIGALPDFLSGPAVGDGRLARVLPEHALPSRHVFALTVSRRGADAKALAFVAHLRAALIAVDRPQARGNS